MPIPWLLPEFACFSFSCEFKIHHISSCINFRFRLFIYLFSSVTFHISLLLTFIFKKVFISTLQETAISNASQSEPCYSTIILTYSIFARQLKEWNINIPRVSVHQVQPSNLLSRIVEFKLPPQQTTISHGILNRNRQVCVFSKTY